MENNKKKGGDTMAKLPGVPVLKFRKALIDAGYKKDRCKGGHETKIYFGLVTKQNNNK